MSIIDIYNTTGSIICHQIRSRSLVLDGLPLPLCARDTGIYMGFFTAVTYIALRSRLKADRPPKTYIAVLLCFLMLPLIFDGVSSYVGIRASTNTIRLFTGAFCGMGLPFFILPAAHFNIIRENSVYVLEKWWEIPVLSVIISVLCIIILKYGLPWLLISTIIIFSFILLIYMLVYVFFSRIKICSEKYILGITASAAVGILGLMYVISNFVIKAYVR